MTIYDTQTRTMLQTDQQFAGINSLSADQKKNADGSIDVILAPEAPAGMEKNWIQTIPGEELVHPAARLRARWNRGSTEPGGRASSNW